MSEIYYIRMISRKKDIIRAQLKEYVRSNIGSGEEWREVRSI
jgi:hypothetical protein